MKAILLHLFVLLFLLAACEKDNDPSRQVLAGVYDEAMDYTELNPALQITFVHDPLLNMEHGKDSLDMDRDGSYDIIISQRNLLGNTPTNANPNDTYPFCSLNIRNGVGVAIVSEPYIIGHGQYSTASWADTIAYQTNVVNITKWSESNRPVTMWAEPPGIFRPSEGPWYNLVNEEKYVAFRMKTNARYRYGWIRVMVTSRERMAFISYAIQI